jgi:Zn-dependent protease with chaperone function
MGQSATCGLQKEFFVRFAWRGVLFLVFLVMACAPMRLFAQSTPAPQTQAAPSAQPVAAYHLPADKLRQAVVLGRIRTTLGITGGLWSIGFLWLFLARGWAAGLARWAEARTQRRWLSGVLFFAIFLLFSTFAELPLGLLGHAVGLHYKISVQGWGGWWADQAKSLALSLLLIAPLLLLFHWLVRRAPRRYWLWLWAVSVPLSLASVFVSPLIIDPIFNKYEPLTAHHAELVPKLEQVVARTGTQIPPERMFLMKASAKSNGINAYVTGIGASKRFVLWDTTTDRMPDDEILFIFGHESGHYVLHHIPKLIAGSLLGLLVAFGLSAHFAGRWASKKASRWHLAEDPEKNPLASRQGFLLILLALSVVSLIGAPISNAFSRHYEHEADVYGQEAIHGIVADPQRATVSSFNHMGAAWLEDPNPSPLVEFWLYNHPSVQHRAAFAAQYDPWTAGGHGRFFAH